MNIRNTCPCCKTYHDSTACRIPEPLLTQEPSLLDGDQLSIFINSWLSKRHGYIYNGVLGQDLAKAILAEYEQRKEKS